MEKKNQSRITVPIKFLAKRLMPTISHVEEQFNPTQVLVESQGAVREEGNFQGTSCLVSLQWRPFVEL